MIDHTLATTAFIAAAAAALFAWRYSIARARLPLPPGPPRRAIIGNLLDLPSGNIWRTYDEWAKTYGDVFSVEVLGQPIVVLTSTSAAQDLLDARSAIYSDRPRLVIIQELMDFTFTSAMCRYGDLWRRKRRALRKYVSPRTAPTYREVQMREARAFCDKLLARPEDFIAEIEQYVIHTITSIVYGMKSEEDVQRHAATAQRAMDYATEAAIPGRYLVDMIPAMKYIPAWFPGAGFQRTAAHVRELVRELCNVPWQTVEKDFAAGTALPSMVAQMIQDGETDTLAKENAASVHVAALDTTSAAVRSFFFVLTAHPEVQQKAQAELDTVVGRARLPDFSDLERLPYVRALISELCRRYPVTPWGVPHATTEDDVYRGYRIPKGSIIIANAWSMLMNPDTYPSPRSFRPERFLHLVNGKTEYDSQAGDVPRSLMFGFGRRACPGRQVAEQAVYAAVVSVLARCVVSPVVGKDGKLRVPEEDFMEGMIMGPNAFRCTIRPRWGGEGPQ